MKKLQGLIIEHAFDSGTHPDGRRWYKANRCTVGLAYGNWTYGLEERLVNAGKLKVDDWTNHCVLTV